MLFATLETSTRQILLNNNQKILMNDTVGFIDQLPHHLIKAFRSTLEEVKEADLLLHVVDSSSPHLQKHINTTKEVLKELGVEDTPVLYVYNKIDKIQDTIFVPEDPYVMISVKEKYNLDELQDKIVSLLFNNYEEVGIASWYGPGFHGQKTSNGEKYNMEDYTAAHKNLPLPSFVKVTNLANNKSVIVRVNDRGPFHQNRILDLSKAAARDLDVIRPGTAKIKVELIKVKSSKPQTDVKVMNGFKPYIQVFTTDDYTKALNIRNLISELTHEKTFIEKINDKFRIKVGPLNENNNKKTLNIIKKNGYENAFFTAK